MFPESNKGARFIAAVCGMPIAVDEANIFRCLEQIAPPFIPPARECLVPLWPAYGFEKNRFYNRAQKSDQPIPVECPGSDLPSPGDVPPAEPGPLSGGLAGVPAGRVDRPFVRFGTGSDDGSVLSSSHCHSGEGQEKKHSGNAMDCSILVSAHPPILMKSSIATSIQRSFQVRENRHEMCWLIRFDFAS